MNSVPDFKLSLSVNHIAVLLIQVDNMSTPGPLVDILEEDGNGGLFALGLALDLDDR